MRFAESTGTRSAATLRTGRRGRDLMFGRTATSPFDHRALQRRADRAWKEAKLERITLHECRHSFASTAIAAGVNIGTVSAALGHASVTITWDRYHHLLPGTMDQAADLIPSYAAAAGWSPLLRAVSTRTTHWSALQSGKRRSDADAGHR